MTVIFWLPKIIARDGGEWKCHYCGHLLVPYHERNDDQYYVLGEKYPPLKPEYRHAVADHVIPKSRGGSDDLSNLVACCEQCNGQKGAKTPEEFLEWKKCKGVKS